jgi:SpoVK/Ycf46/Vps4 family AAA+-type ATPase
LHGNPINGKTLVVGALIGACSQGNRRIAYFGRKGDDCLGKYVGDAERQLKLLFQFAERCQSYIIFFDEMFKIAYTPMQTYIYKTI